VWQKYREKYIWKNTQYRKTENIIIMIFLYYIVVLYNIMPSRRLSAALIPVQGGGVKKAGLPNSIGASLIFKIRCKQSGCKANLNQ